MPLGLAYRRCRYAFCWILFLAGSRFFLGLGGWCDPGVSMLNLQQTGSALIRQGLQLSEGMRCLSSSGTTVPLLLDNLVAVTMIVLTVECPYLVSVCGSVSVTGQPVQFTSSGQLFLGRRRFGRFGRFELFLRCSPLTLLFRDSLSMLQVPPVFGRF